MTVPTATLPASTPLNPPASSTAPQRLRKDRRKINWWATAFVAVCSLTVLIPLLLAVNVALQTPEQMAAPGATGLELPTQIRWANFADAWRVAGLSQALVNTSLITVGSVIGTLFVSSIVSWAIARNLNHRFFKGAYFYLLAALFVPFPIIMLPLVKQTAIFNMDNPAGLIVLYSIFGLSLNVFIYTAYIRSIPFELEESARMDGASTWQVFWKVIFPLLGPINATVGILTVVWAWNDFIMPLVVLTDPGSRTISLSMFVFQGQFNVDHNLAFSAYLMAMAPLVLVYVFAQRWVISGVVRGSIK